MRYAILLFSTSLLLADNKTIESDPKTDFSAFHTFSVRNGTIASKKPEIKNPLMRQKISDAIHDQLTAKGLTDQQQRPDLIVNFHLGAADKRQVQSWPAGRWGWGTRHTTYRFTEGTLVIDLIERETHEMVWRGVYTDDEDNPGKLAKKITDDVKKLFEKYPPKK